MPSIDIICSSPHCLVSQISGGGNEPPGIHVSPESPGVPELTDWPFSNRVTAPNTKRHKSCRLFCEPNLSFASLWSWASISLWKVYNKHFLRLGQRGPWPDLETGQTGHGSSFPTVAGFDAGFDRFQFWWWLALSPHGEFQNDGYISVIISMFSSKFVVWHLSCAKV